MRISRSTIGISSIVLLATLGCGSNSQNSGAAAAGDKSKGGAAGRNGSAVSGATSESTAASAVGGSGGSSVVSGSTATGATSPIGSTSLGGGAGGATTNAGGTRATNGGALASGGNATLSLGGSSAVNGGTLAAYAGAAGANALSGVPIIVVDQFGYRPESEKIAVIRDPQTGFDAATDFAPSTSYSLIDATTGTSVFQAAPTPWNAGATHAQSGDKAYWFDFSSVTKPGTYYVFDSLKGQRSPVFRIASDVYRSVLYHALRTFFYQRVGQAKQAPYAESGWVDAASHVGSLQDHHARRYNAKNDATTERDVWGGWYDAGDYNKYTSWTANYIVEMLQAYEENPAAFGDDFAIPESGNGVSDLLDEARWGLEYLARLQSDDGSLLSVVGEASGSPPSAASGQTLYGTANTSGTLSAAAAFAAGARSFAKVPAADFATWAATLATRANKAFAWAEANPAVTFRNNDSASGTSGLASGQQEVDATGLVMFRLKAAVHLFRLTADAKYRAIVDELARQTQFLKNSFVYPFETDRQDMLLYYAGTDGATATLRDSIRSTYKSAVTTGSENLPAHTGSKDPYLAYMKDYVWGSNSTKSNQGNIYWAMVTHGIDTTQDATMKRIAERYVHYIHGLNPLGLVYLSNMRSAGAERSANEFYHSWYADGSARWDRVGVSTHGPAPGFLTGGPNPQYALDSCCPSGCGSTANNALCNVAAVTPPLGQPAMKSYLDFNGNWPQNSWSVTENSCGYQIAYIRLLSKFVN